MSARTQKAYKMNIQVQALLWIPETRTYSSP